MSICPAAGTRTRRSGCWGRWCWPRDRRHDRGEAGAASEVVIRGGQWVLRLEAEAPYPRMVLEVSPHAQAVDDGLDAEMLQVGMGTNAGEQRSHGVWIAPAHRITSRNAPTEHSSPSSRNSTPVQRVPVSVSLTAGASVRTVRLRFPITGRRYASARLQRL